MSTTWAPKRFHTITPNIVVDDAEVAVAFLKEAFGFVENYRLTTSSGKIAHCEVQLGDSIVNIAESMDGSSVATLLAQIYVEDADALFRRAVEVGATILMPMRDMLCGSREGRVEDPCGNVWTIATLKETVEPAEMQRRMLDHEFEDARKDALIVAGTGHCNDQWKPKNVKNNSQTRYITVTIQEVVTREGKRYTRTMVFDKLAPKEEREIGCSGCGWTTGGYVCTGYSVVAAIYVNP